MFYDSIHQRLKRCASSRCCLREVETRDSIVLKGCKGQKVYKRSRPSMEHLSQMFSSRMGCCTRSRFNGATWVEMFAFFDWRRATPVVFSELISVICDPHHFLKMSFGTCLLWADACTCNSSFSISQQYEVSIFVARCYIDLTVSEMMTVVPYVAFFFLSTHLSYYDAFYLLLANIYVYIVVLTVTGYYQKDMPVQKVNDSSDLDAKVPSHLQRTSITSLTTTSEPSHRCVKVWSHSLMVSAPTNALFFSIIIIIVF